MALPEGTVTFLFSDVEGSAQLARRLGDRYADVLADHLRLLRTAFGEQGVHEIDTQGDSLFVAFPRAKDAVVAAAAAQRALAEHSWPDGCELRVRMGLHTGEAVVTDDRYLGVAVHHAARICAAGHGGQVLLSQSTAAVLEDDPLDGIQLRELGHHQLKDFDRPERIFQLVIHGLRAEFPPLRAQHHLGRLIDHVHLRVRNLEASKRFYDAVLEALGHELSGEGEGYFSADELFASDDGEPTAHLHLAFQARDRETVDAFYEAALGGRRPRQRGSRRASLPPRLLRGVRARPGWQQHRGGPPRPRHAVGRVRRRDARGMTRLYDATGDGIARLDERAGGWTVDLSLAGAARNALPSTRTTPKRSWSFPPRPWTSHVRWIAPSPHDADVILVGIELGGLMRSTDGGETWHAADEGRDLNYTWSVPSTRSTPTAGTSP